MFSLQRSQSLPSLHELLPLRSPALSDRSSLALCQSLDRQRLEAALHQHAGSAVALALPAAHFTALLTELGCALDNAHATVSSSLSFEEQSLTHMVKLVIEDPQLARESCTADSACEELLQAIMPAIDRLENDQADDASPREHRALAVLDCLSQLFGNDFTSANGRRAANLALATVRTGLITCVTTVMRQLIGYAVERSLLLADVPVNQRLIFSIASQLLGPALNVAGAIRQECQGTATPQSRISRGVMLMLSVGSLIAASQVQPQMAALSAMSGLSVQIASYCLARDLIQAFLPLSDNAPLTLGGTLAADAVYAGMQFGAGVGMDLLAPNSGAGYVRSVAEAARGNGDLAGIQTRVAAALDTLTPMVGHDLLRGVINGLPEIADDLTRSGISRQIQVNRNISAAHLQALARGQNPTEAIAALPAEQTEGLRLRLGVRCPTPAQIANQFLTTGAMRLSAFEIVLSAAVAGSAAMSQLGLSNTEESLAANAVVALMIGAIYPPFVYAHHTKPPSPATPPEMELRLRRPDPQP